MNGKQVSTSFCKMLLICLSYIALILIFLPYLSVKYLNNNLNAGLPISGIEGQAGPSQNSNLFLFQIQFPGFMVSNQSAIKQLASSPLAKINGFHRDGFSSSLTSLVSTGDRSKISDLPASNIHNTATLDSETFPTFAVPNTNLTLNNRGTLLVYRQWMCSAPYQLNVQTIPDGREVSKVYVSLSTKNTGEFLYDPDQDIVKFHEQILKKPFNESNQVFFPLTTVWDAGLVPRPVDFENMECFYYRNKGGKQSNDARWPDIVDILNFSGDRKFKASSGNNLSLLTKQSTRDLFINNNDTNGELKIVEKNNLIDGLETVDTSINTYKSYTTYQSTITKSNKMIWLSIKLIYIAAIGNSLFLILAPIFVDVRKVHTAEIEMQENEKTNSEKSQNWGSNCFSSMSKCITNAFVKALNVLKKIPSPFSTKNKSCTNSGEGNVDMPMNLQTGAEPIGPLSTTSAKPMNVEYKPDGTVEFLDGYIDGYVSEEEESEDEDEGKLFTECFHLYEGGKIRAKIHEAELKRESRTVASLNNFVEIIPFSEPTSGGNDNNNDGENKENCSETQENAPEKTLSTKNKDINGLYSIKYQNQNQFVCILLSITPAILFFWIIFSFCVAVILPILFDTFTDSNLDLIVHNLLTDMYPKYSNTLSGTFIETICVFKGTEGWHGLKSSGYEQMKNVGGLLKITLAFGCFLPCLYFGYWMHKEVKQLVGYFNMKQEGSNPNEVGGLN